MKVDLAYGDGVLGVEFPGDRTAVITPLEQAGLPNEEGSFRAALDAPIGAGARVSVLSLPILPGLLPMSGSFPGCSVTCASAGFARSG